MLQLDTMKNRHHIIYSILFVAVELCLLLCVLFMNNSLVRYVSFASVLLAFVYSLTFISTKSKSHPTQLGLLFTVIADIFLVLLKAENKLIAMIAFSITQILYCIRIYQETINPIIKKLNLIIRTLLIIVVQIITICILQSKTDALSLVSMFYYTNLVVNLIFACINIKRSPLMAIGLLFFLLCDTVIGLQQTFNSYIIISTSAPIYKLVFSSFNLAWLFYIPSQTLICISCKTQHKSIM